MYQLSRLLVLIVLVLLAAGSDGLRAAEAGKLKCGFIYPGPVGDDGFVYAHEQARKTLEKEFPWMESVVLDSVTEDQLDSYIDRMVSEGVKVIFTVSTSYMEGTMTAAQRHPDIIFANSDGFKRAPNVANYVGEFYQCFYLDGLMAGALTKTNKTGFIAAFPESEAKRFVDAFALGAREVNPKATVQARWINEWYNPPAVEEATEALISEGTDVLGFSDDSPTVVQVAARHGLPSFSMQTSMYQFAPTQVVSGELARNDVFYRDFLKKVHDGTYTAHNLQNVDFWARLDSGGVEVGAKPGMTINPVFVDRLKAVVIDHPEFGKISVYDLVLKRLAQMSQPQPTYDPFWGPVKDPKGVVRVAAGVHPDKNTLLTLEWRVPGVEGSWPKEP